MYRVLNFYKFVELDQLSKLREQLLDVCQSHSLIGTILLAPEGINGRIAGLGPATARLAEFFQADSRLADMRVQRSQGRTRPYKNLYVKIKPWIVRFRDEQDPSVAEVTAGPKMSPCQLRQHLDDHSEDVVLVDTRNWYETDYGTFAGAVKLPIKSFVDFPAAFEQRFSRQKHKKFVFFCTGGIRCEKVVPWARAQGYENATQLDGGITNYFQDVGGDGFEGQCFVFDHRWILDPGLSEADVPDCNLRIQPKPLVANSERSQGEEPFQPA